MKGVLFLLEAFFYLSVSSCGIQKPIDDSSIVKIEFYAMRKGIEFSHRISSFDELKKEARDTIIDDRIFISSFVKEINRLKPDSLSHSVDYRAGALLYRDKGRPLSILFGEYFGIVYEGKNMKDQESLFKLINDRIYSTQPYEYWYPDEESRLLYRFINSLDGADK